MRKVVLKQMDMMSFEDFKKAVANHDFKVALLCEKENQGCGKNAIRILKFPGHFHSICGWTLLSSWEDDANFMGFPRLDDLLDFVESACKDGAELYVFDSHNEAWKFAVKWLENDNN